MEGLTLGEIVYLAGNGFSCAIRWLLDHGLGDMIPD